MLAHRPSFAAVLSASSRVWLPAAALLVWAAVAFSAVAWGLRWSAMGAGESPTASPAQALPTVETAAAARSLGAAPMQAASTPSLASRFQLQGVLAGNASQGAALIAVDGKPAKPYRVGAMVAEGWVLQAVQGRRVSLGATLDGPQMLSLELPVKK